jgi:hypothetical protein
MTDNEWERIGASIDAAIEGRAKPPASDTNLREQVARAIDDLVVTVCEGGIDEVADAALAVATPLIRAQVIEELIAAWEAKPSTYEDVMGATVMFDLTKWLRAQADEPDDRKIYIGFKDKPKDKGKEDDQ